MATNTLALLNRPATWDQMVGQEISITILKNSLKNKLIKPAYLFSGLTGSGKTTAALIFAKALVCENMGTNSNPCNVCRQCDLLNRKMNPDVRHFDSSSDRGVEFVRNTLKPFLAQAAINGRCKVAILDETHLMTKDAIASLLILFEQMPQSQSKSVVIMCTTNGNALDPAVQNRSLCLNFSPIDLDVLVDTVSEATGYNSEAVRVIARESGGSFRTLWSHIEKLELLGGDLPLETIYRIFGGVSKEERKKLWSALAQGRVDTVSTLWSKWIAGGAKASILSNHLMQDLVEWAVSNPLTSDWRRPLAILSSAQISNPETAWPHTLFMLSGLPLDFQEGHRPEPANVQPQLSLSPITTSDESHILNEYLTSVGKRLLMFGA